MTPNKVLAKSFQKIPLNEIGFDERRESTLQAWGTNTIFWFFEAEKKACSDSEEEISLESVVPLLPRLSLQLKHGSNTSSFI